jgi:hypothetical protein
MTRDAVPAVGPPAMRVWIGGHERRWRALLKPVLSGTIHPADGPVEAAFLLPVTIDEAGYFARKLSSRVIADGHVWVLYAGAITSMDPPAGSPFSGLRSLLRTLGWRRIGVAFPRDGVAAACFERMSAT